MLKRKMPSVAFLVMVLSYGSLVHAQAVITIDVPGADSTRVLGLNAHGDVCGGVLLGGERLAFAGTRQADFSDLTTFKYPGAIFTQCRGINAAGQMVGAYQSPDGKFHAFVKDGPEFISFDIPGATDTVAEGIDPQGEIVGRYTTPDTVTHGFFRSRDGEVLTIDAPKATWTEASGITPRGDITGVYRTADLNGVKVHGFILSADGFETVDVPGALNTGSASGGMWMSASGELAGYYRPLGATSPHAYVRFRDGTFATYLVPGSADTCFFNINERGDLAGRYIMGGKEHGVYIERLGRRPPGE
jgi:hypothetical protein